MATKLTVPVVFFGYALFANVFLFEGDAERPVAEGFFRGGFTRQIDTLYKANLPHREPAVGLIGAARYVLLNEGRKGVMAGEKGWLFTGEEYRDQSAAVSALPDTIAWMTQVRDKLAARGTALVIVPIPAKLEVDQSWGPDADQATALGQTYDRFLAAVADAGIQAVDTRSALTSQQTPFFRTDTHWTSEGAAAVAGQVAASGLISLGKDTFTKIEGAPVTFTGDLVSFVTSGGLAPSIGLEAEHVTPYVAELADAPNALGGMDLFGSAGEVPYDLVGTSYSANANWSFAEALKLDLGHDVLNYAEEGQGPIAPMKAYLDALDPTEFAPVVIWEFPIRYLSDPKLRDTLKMTDGGENA